MCADFFILNVWTVLFCVIFFFICKCRTWYLNYWYHFHCLWFSIGYGYDTIYFFLCYTMIWVIECPRQFFVHLLIFFWSSWHLFSHALVKYMYTNVHLGETHVYFFFGLILFFATIVLEWKSNANGILTLNAKGLIWTLLFVLQYKYIYFWDIMELCSNHH